MTSPPPPAPFRPWLHGAAAALALALIALALLQLAAANGAVTAEHRRLGPTPVRLYAPPDADARPAPVVVISHGFAGSQQLMEPFAVTLARNGYLAVTFDYQGHGRNLQPLAGDVTKVEGATRRLLEQTGKVVDFALDQPEAGEGLALLGHSMASDIVARYAGRDDRVDATIAVSMFSPAVTADSPGNLLIIVGDFEGFLKKEALEVLGQVTAAPQAGVTYGSFDAGTARRVAFADGVEHVGVLYSPDSMRESVEWLNAVFRGTPPAAPTYVDDRGGAIVLLFAGLVLLGWPLATLLPRISTPPAGASLRWRTLLPVALVPAVGTPLLLWWFPADFLSVLVGGYVAVHFGVYGVVTAASFWWWRRRRSRESAGRAPPARAATAASGSASPSAPTPGRAVTSPRPSAIPRDGRRLALFLLATTAVTAYTAGAVALIMDAYVTSFAITAPRLPLVFAMLAGTLSYFLADEWVTRGENTPPGAHALTRVCFLFSLALAVALSFEDLFFLLIIAFVIAIYFIVYGLFSGWVYRATGHPFVGAVANAIAFAWALAVVFPMMSG